MIKGTTYLILEKSSRGYRGLVVKSARSRKPRLGPNQIAIKIKLAVPGGAFEQSIPEASITVPDLGQIIQPRVELDNSAVCDCAVPDEDDEGNCRQCEGLVTA